jgi:hypothetical protein
MPLPTHLILRAAACLSAVFVLTGCNTSDDRARDALSAYQAAAASNDLIGARRALLELVRAKDDVPDYWIELGKRQAISATPIMPLRELMSSTEAMLTSSGQLFNLRSVRATLSRRRTVRMNLRSFLRAIPGSSLPAVGPRSVSHVSTKRWPLATAFLRVPPSIQLERS